MLSLLRDTIGLVAVASFTLLSACTDKSDVASELKSKSSQAIENPEGVTVNVNLDSKSATEVLGKIKFTQEGDNLHVEGKVYGLEPNSNHGFHIHEKGDCSAPDASSAGGHFAPMKNPHGAPSSDSHHAGDLGNIQADADGEAIVSMNLPQLSLGEREGRFNILSRALVVHDKADDLKSQPSGAAGPRVACGVINGQVEN